MAIRQQTRPFGSTFVASPTNAMGLIIDGSTDTGALADPTASNTAPTGGVRWVENHQAARFVFGGSNADNETVNYQVILWRLATSGENDAFVPEVIAKGAYTLGADVYAATNIGAGTEFWADTITDTINSPGVYIISPEDDTRAILEVPLKGAVYVEVITDLGTAATADVFMQLGELTGSTDAVADMLSNLSYNSGAPDGNTLRVEKAVVGNPTFGFDALAANDSYQNIFTTPNDGVNRHNASIRCETSDMIVSFDAGSTDHMYIVASDKPVWYGDLLILPNTVIAAKNAGAGQNYVNAAISIW